MKKFLIMLTLSIILTGASAECTKNCFYSKKTIISANADNLKSGTAHVSEHKVKPKVAFINIPQPCDQRNALKILIKASRMPEILGIVLVIDNGGGSGPRYSALYDLIKQITAIKPVVGLVIGNALSGGYQVASATNHIIASAGSNIGSIGVIYELEKITDTRKVSEPTNSIEGKVDMEVFVAGEYKAIYSSYHPLSENQRNYLNESLAKSYNYLLDTVSEARQISRETYKDWAEGKIFLGTEALELGLIDELGTFFNAEEKVLELIKQKNPGVAFDNTIETVELN